MKLFRILDPFTLTLITVVLLASFFPAEGGFVPVVEGITTAAIALLFFMHGAKLSREAIIAGGSHWRLHLWVMCSTFVLFPVLGVLFAWWAPVNVDPMLYSGFLYLCILPATVQSAIAFTSLAGGNVAAAVCSASASSLLGIFLSPLLVGLVMNIMARRAVWKRWAKLCCNCCCLLCWDTCLARGSATGSRATKSGSRKRIRPLFCWWSTRRSAKRWSTASGTKSAGDRCCLSSWSASYCWRSSSLLTSLSPVNAASIKPTKSLLFSAVRKKAWPTGSRWPIFCFRRQCWV